jgi:hypothetical protein
MAEVLLRFNKIFLIRASGRLVLFLLAITIISFVLMAAVVTPAFQEATNGLRPFDLNFGITAEVIYRDLPIARGPFIFGSPSQTMCIRPLPLLFLACSGPGCSTRYRIDSLRV